MVDGGTVWTELPEDIDISGGVRSEEGGLPAQPDVIKEYGRFAYLEGKNQRNYALVCKTSPCNLELKQFISVMLLLNTYTYKVMEEKVSETLDFWYH